MTLHIFIGILIGLALYFLFTRRSQGANLQSASDHNIGDHNSHNEPKHKNSTRNNSKGHGCCG